MKPLDKSAHIAKRRRNLPHWEQAGCTYFVTWRLADSLPVSQLREWQDDRERWLALNPQPWTPRVQADYQRESIDRIEHWLDAGHGSCVLRRPDVRSILSGTLHFFNGERYELDGAVIMPNHVHVLVTPICEGDTAFPGCDSATGFPARDPHAAEGALPPPAGEEGKSVALSGGEGFGPQAGKPVSLSHSLSSILQSWKGFSAREINRVLGRTGPLWMDENFDHTVRSSEQLAHFQRYLAENPVKARLKEDEYYLWQKSDTGFPACESHPAKGALLNPVAEEEISTALTGCEPGGPRAGKPVSHSRANPFPA